MKSIKTAFTSLMVLGAVLTAPAVVAADNVVEKAQANPEQVQTTASMAVMDKVNINTASAEEIRKSLIGIGAKKAEAIVQYREKHGAFTAAEQLMEIQGIGKATFEKNKERIIF